MANDAFEPGPDGSYPHWPRKTDGTSDPVRMPKGLRRQKVPGTNHRVLIDVTPRDNQTGEPIEPPVIPPNP
jgi:hypothetical protein